MRARKLQQTRDKIEQEGLLDEDDYGRIVPPKGVWQIRPNHADGSFYGYDAWADMFGYDQFQKMVTRNIIEVAPLAYMRGRTLEESFIILDEAQNTTKEQMKMFLTRMGNHSRVVVNGDVTQIDLVDRKMSGLIEAQKVLQNVRGLGMVYFTDEDVVRHDMVGRIIRAYEDFYKKE